MSKKLIIIAVAVLAVVAGAYKFVLAGPAEAEVKPKIEGSVYVLPKEFLVNLADSRYAKFTVALVVDHIPEAHAGDSPPEGYGVMPEEGVVRGIVTDVVGASTASRLSDAEGRKRVRETLKKQLKKSTDLEIHEVVFPDITVQ